jgi:hypothetical protein
LKLRHEKSGDGKNKPLNHSSFHKRFSVQLQPRKTIDDEIAEIRS